MKWHHTRSGSNLGICKEHVEGDLAQFDDIFCVLVSVNFDALFSAAPADLVGNGCEWMKWHGMRPGSSLGMCMEHVEGVLARFDDIFHGLVAVDVYMLFSAAMQIM